MLGVGLPALQASKMDASVSRSPAVASRCVLGGSLLFTRLSGEAHLDISRGAALSWTFHREGLRERG
jgi:hypothetical protein